MLVARLVSGGPLGGPALAPAFAPVRGTDRGPLTYQAEDIQVVIEVQQQATRPDLGMILGLVIGWDTPQELQAHLWRAEQRLASTPVDELGNFDFSDIARSRYELILSGPEIEVHIQDLDTGTL